MPDERDSRPVAKLVLLMQACCDPRLSAADHGALAAILDACFDKPRTYIGPASVARVASMSSRNAYRSYRNLDVTGYVRLEKRSARTFWIYPNFDFAERSGSLVEWEEGEPKKVNRPFKPPAFDATTTDTSVRKGKVTKAKTTDTRVRNEEKSPEPTADISRTHSGHFASPLRTPASTEAVLETVTEAVGPFASLEEQRQQRDQERREQIRSQYLRARESDPLLVRIMERDQVYRKHIEDLIGGESDRGSNGEAIDAAA